MKTQKQKIKEHLIRYDSITSWEAIVNYSITRLAEYIRQLRREGMSIRTEYCQNKKSVYAKYILNELSNNK